MPLVNVIGCVDAVIQQLPLLNVMLQVSAPAGQLQAAAAEVAYQGLHAYHQPSPLGQQQQKQPAVTHHLSGSNLSGIGAAKTAMYGHAQQYQQQVVGDFIREQTQPMEMEH